EGGRGRDGRRLRQRSRRRGTATAPRAHGRRGYFRCEETDARQQGEQERGRRRRCEDRDARKTRGFAARGEPTPACREPPRGAGKEESGNGGRRGRQGRRVSGIALSRPRRSLPIPRT